MALTDDAGSTRRDGSERDPGGARRPDRNDLLGLLILLTVAGGTLVVLGGARAGAPWGDEVTFVAMAESLAADLDLTFDERDFPRVAPESEAVIVHRADDLLAYSKPPLYPLVAAPLVRIFGPVGCLLTNGLCLLLAALVAYPELARRTDRPGIVLATFLAAAGALPYVGWAMSETLQLSLALAAASLWSRGARSGCDRGGRGAAVAGALLGLLASLRPPNALLLAAPIAAELGARRWRRAGSLLLGGSLALAAAAGVGLLLQGTVNPYRAERTTLDATTGYPTSAAEAADELMAHPARHRTPGLGPVDARVAYSALYFLVGRHTGLLLYLPFALVLAATALRERDGPGLAALLGALALGVFYLAWQPWNYFGGATMIGNRYWLPAYPFLLVAPRRLPGRRALASTWGLLAAVAVSALVAVHAHRAAQATSQSHTLAGLFRWSPYESTADAIDGRRDRYWAGEFVRFVDPFPVVRSAWFELEAEVGRGAELLLARREAGPVRFWVASSEPELELEWRDWGRRERLRLGPREGGVRQEIALELSPAWRRHPFWWRPDLAYRAHTLRLRLTSLHGSARLHALGDGRPLQVFSRRLERSEVVAAADGAAVQGRVVNTSPVAWRSDGPLPVRLAWRRLGPGDEVLTEHHEDLPGLVAAGGTFAFDVPIPVLGPGERFELDLVAEDYAWFAERLGSPLWSSD